MGVSVGVRKRGNDDKPKMKMNSNIPRQIKEETIKRRNSPRPKCEKGLGSLTNFFDQEGQHSFRSGAQGSIRESTQNDSYRVR